MTIYCFRNENVILVIFQMSTNLTGLKTVFTCFQLLYFLITTRSLYLLNRLEYSIMFIRESIVDAANFFSVHGHKQHQWSKAKNQWSQAFYRFSGNVLILYGTADLSTVVNLKWFFHLVLERNLELLLFRKNRPIMKNIWKHLSTFWQR